MAVIDLNTEELEKEQNKKPSGDVGLGTGEIERPDYDQSSVELRSVIDDVEQSAKIYSDGRNAWAAQFFTEETPFGREQFLEIDDSAEIKSKDVAGTLILDDLQKENADSLYKKMKDGLGSLLSTAEADRTRVLEEKEKSGNFGISVDTQNELIDRIKGTQEKLENLRDQQLKEREFLEREISIAEKKEAFLNAIPQGTELDQITRENFLKKRQELLDKTEEPKLTDDARASELKNIDKQLNPSPDRVALQQQFKDDLQIATEDRDNLLKQRKEVLEDKDPELTDDQRKRKVKEIDRELRSREVDIAVNSDLVKFAENKDRNTSAAEDEKLAEEIKKNREDNSKKLGELETKQRQQVVGLMDEARKEVQDHNVQRAAIVAEAYRVNDEDDKYKAAKGHLNDHADIAKVTQPPVSAQIKGADEYAKDVANGELARKALRSQDLLAFVTAMEEPLNQHYQEKADLEVARVRASRDKNAPLTEEEEKEIRASVNQELENMKGRLGVGASPGRSQLSDQMMAVMEQVQEHKPRLSDDFVKETRKHLLEKAIEHVNNEGDDRNFALDFLKNDTRLAGKGMAPVNFNEAKGERVSEGFYYKKNDDFREPAQVDMAKVSKIHFTTDDHGHRIVKFTTVGGGYDKNKGEIILTGKEAEKVYRNGLDLSDARSDGKLFVNVDSSTGIGSGEKLKLFGTHNKNLFVTAIDSSGDNDRELRTRMYDSVVSAGNSDGNVDRHIGKRVGHMNESFAMEEKRLLEQGRQQFEVANFNKASAGLDAQELAALDRNKDGKLSTREITPALAKYLETQLGQNPEAIAALRAMNSGQIRDVELAKLGTEIQKPTVPIETKVVKGKDEGRGSLS